VFGGEAEFGFYIAFASDRGRMLCSCVSQVPNADKRNHRAQPPNDNDRFHRFAAGIRSHAVLSLLANLRDIIASLVGPLADVVASTTPTKFNSARRPSLSVSAIALSVL